MTRAGWWAVAAAVVLALAVRLAAPDARPMHHDEANQAVRFGQLLETGAYRYDPSDHHGPTLYYATLPAAWIRGQRTLATLDERTLRAVPAVFGAAVVFLLVPLRRAVGPAAVAAGAALVGVAPPLVYYSRFYIQESLLLFFSLGFVVACGRAVRDRSTRWAAASGLFAGLALATKETALVLVPVGAGACLVAAWRAGRGDAGAGDGAPQRWRRIFGLIAAGTCVAAAVCAIFYSSFGANPGGVVEAARAPWGYVERGLNPASHRAPWFEYLRLMSSRSPWVDAGLVLLALAALAAAWRPHAGPGGSSDREYWVRLLACYAAVATAVFSALPYKTPWNLISFAAPWLLLCGIGAAVAVERARTTAWRVVVWAGLAAVACGLAGRSWEVNFRYPADPRNPYAYVQAGPDVVRLAERVRTLSALHRDGGAMLVAVVAGASEQWPLPWYLRRMPNVGYWTSPAAAATALVRAPVIIASPEFADEVSASLGDRCLSEYYGLRPGVLVTVFIDRALWDRFIAGVG